MPILPAWDESRGDDHVWGAMKGFSKSHGPPPFPWAKRSRGGLYIPPTHTPARNHELFEAVVLP